jgi:hypothetical protein
VARRSAELKPGAQARIPPVRRRRWLRRVLLGLLILGLIGFGVFWWYARGPGSLYWTLASYRDDYAPKIEQWNRLMTRLPPVGSVANDECRRDLNPLPRFVMRGDEGNCEIYLRTHEFAMSYPDWRKAPTFYTWPDGPLRHGVTWYDGPGIGIYKWNGSLRNDRIEKNLKLGLQRLYLVVLRPRLYEPAIEIEDSRVHGGALELEGVMFDLRTEEKLGQFVVATKPSPTFAIRWSRTQSSDGESDVVSSARESMIGNAQTQLMAKLRDLTGGEFEW